MSWTERGRIVYDRKRHFFKARDLARVARAMPPPETLNDALMSIATVGAIFADLLAALVRVAYGIPASFVISKVTGFMLDIVNIFFDSLDLSESELKRLKTLRDILSSF